MPTFVAGYNKGVTFQLSGAGGATTLLVKSWSWDEAVEKLDVTHTGTTGIQAVIAGILRGDGTVEANVDITALPNATPPTIIPGSKGTITFNVGSSTPHSCPVMVAKVHWASAVDGVVNYSFDTTLDYLTGTYTRAT